MAIELITKMWCDVHAQDNEQVEAETVTVSINGDKPQAVELCAECVAQYVTPLKQLLTSEGRAATKSARPKKAAPAKAASSVAPKEVRAWARENGFDVPARGKIPTEVHEAFAAAH